jgi:hypothetical protein
MLTGIWNQIPNIGAWFKRQYDSAMRWARSIVGGVGKVIGDLWGGITSAFGAGRRSARHPHDGGVMRLSEGGRTKPQYLDDGGESSLIAQIGRVAGRMQKAQEGAIAANAIFGGVDFRPVGTDTVPAVLTPGEYVLRRRVVDMIGVQNLDALNQGRMSFADLLDHVRLKAEQGKPNLTGRERAAYVHTRNDLRRAAHRAWMENNLMLRDAGNQDRAAKAAAHRMRATVEIQALSNGGAVRPSFFEAGGLVPDIRTVSLPPGSMHWSDQAALHSQAGDNSKSQVIDRRINVEKVEINNPVPERASESFGQSMRKLAYFGSTGGDS